MENDKRAEQTMRVYHLLPRKWALSDLKHRRLKVATFDDINDPFELRGARMDNSNDRKRFNDWRSRTAAKLGLLCFSKCWRSPVLWSHYADEHKGICLGFDVPDSCLKEVQYVAERLKFRHVAPDKSQLQKLLRTKFEDWRYEGEWRRVVRLHDTHKADGHHFWPFGGDLKLREVVLGARCKVGEQDLEKQYGQGLSRIKLKQARTAFQTFNVVTNLRGVG